MQLEAVAAASTMTVVELGPLLGREHAADSEEHLSVGFLKFCTGIRNLVNLE
jgi:hypothetical protein